VRVDYGNKELNDIIEELRPKLPEYLIKHSVLPENWSRETNPLFKCINPDHEDKTPSMGFIPRTDFKIARCWSCQAKVDIFRAATWIEGLPDSGKEWVTETVYGLARDFELDFKEYEPSTEELARARILEMLADASDCLTGLIITSKICNGFQHTKNRGIGEEICKKMGVGTVDWDEFVKTMRQYGGWDLEFMEAHGITRMTFGREFITITLRDHRGVCVGFDRRFALYNKEDEANMRRLGKSTEYPKKWFLPRKSDIFEPRTFLYGLHLAKQKSYRQLDIVEGYFDALAGMQAGHETIVACCGTNGLNSEQMDLLVQLGFEDICIVFDSDPAGQKAMERYLKEFGGKREFRLKFKFLNWPDTNIAEKDRDPDTFFRLYCGKDLKAYDETPVFSSFRVALQLEIDKGTQGVDLARSQIPHIAGEPDPLLRGRMIKELSEKTNVSEIDIRSSVDQILSGKARNIARDLLRDIQKLEGSNTPQELSTIIKRAESKLSPLFGGSAQNITGKAAEKTYFEAMDFFDNDRGVIAGYRTGIPVLDNEMGGIQKGMFWVLAGGPNAGKSAWVHQVVSGMVKHYKENKDMVILFFSFDDTTQWAWAKQLAIHSGLPIKWVARPQKYIYHDRELTVKYRETQEFFRKRVGETIRIFGGDIGMNIEQVKKAIRDVNESLGGRHCIIVVDSFNKLHGVDGIEGHEKYSRNADELHQLMHDGKTIICTSEIVKSAQGRKPKMTDMADTKKISHNANVCSIVYNPLHEERERANYFHVRKDEEKGWKKSAVLELDFNKNKITDFKEQGIFQFNDHIGSFEQIDNIRAYMDVQRALWREHGKDNVLQEGGKRELPKSVFGMDFSDIL
jgi:DNA primase/uncharacterized phage-like protein YoqJ